MRKVNLLHTVKDWAAKDLEHVASIAITDEDESVIKISASQNTIDKHLGIKDKNIVREDLVNDILEENNVDKLTEDEILYLNKPLFGRIDRTIQTSGDLKIAAGIKE